MKNKNLLGSFFGFITLISSFITISCVFLNAWVPFGIFIFITLITFGVFIKFRSIELKTLFKSRQFRYGLNVFVSIIGVIGIVVFINIIVSQKFNKSIDITKFKHYSISEQSKQILKNLDKEINVIAFFKDTNPEKQLVQEQLEAYQLESNLINVSIKNPELQIDLKEKYDIRIDGTTVFDSGDRFERVTIVNEQAFTTAIIRLIQDTTQKVYFLTGHGEHGIDGSSNFRYSQVKTELEKVNYSVNQLLLLKENKIPDDCDVLVIAGPKTPLKNQEIRIIERYLKNNGKLLLLIDPSMNNIEDTHNGLVSLMEKWGVKIGNDFVIDRHHFFVISQGSIGLNLNFLLHDITQHYINEAIPFIYCRSVSPDEKQSDKLSIKTILETKSPIGVSWAEKERDPDGAFSSNGYTPNVDLPGPVSVGIIVEEKKNEITFESDNTQTRIVVIGDSDFATDAIFATNNPDVPAYAPFITSIINWLSYDEELITIKKPNPKSEVLRKMNINQMRVVQVISVFLLPILIFITGIVVWWYRREGGTQ
ncbi:GldG family protein [Candidatus Poribacteria bacterium]|nr:GldG family protein [Candidatus Poribacteria bacterium]